MKVLVLGASGLVGGNCVKVFESKENVDVVGTYFSFETENTVFFDTLNPQNPENFNVDEFKPNVIVHCGALTHVDYCEDHQEESYQKTVQSTLNAIELCKKFNAKLVYLSTDYVFDGTKGFYKEEDEVNPLSIYGKHKLEAELAVKKELADFVIVRITNVYGDEVRGKNFIARLSVNMQKGEPMELRLPYDQYATPANAFDIAKAIWLLVNDKKVGIYHFGSTDYLNRIQLCQKVAQYFGHDKVVINPISTKEMNQAADRPLLGGFSTEKFIKEYPGFYFSNVDDYVKKLKLNSTY